MSSLDISQKSFRLTRFHLLWLRQQPNFPDGSEAVYQQLLTAYNEPHRVYHNLSHIEHCLTIFDKVSDLMDNPDSVELAIWFHDVIYTLGDKKNEQLSADLFMTLTDGLFNNEFRDNVYQHIMATCHNCLPITNRDTKLMVDIDLSSFGLPWADFIHDSENVRAEMSYMPDSEYYDKQKCFQLSLLSQSSFYNSDYFQQHYESQARSNLKHFFAIMGN